MKKIILSILSLATFGATAQNVNIPDANFKAFLVGNSAINTNSDTEIQVSEANAYNGLIDCSSMNIASLTGIEEFTSIFTLNCKDNQISSIDISNNSALTNFYCDSNQLTYLDLSLNTNLQYVTCSFNPLESLNAANGANNSIQLFGCENNASLTCIQIDAGYTPHSFWWKDASASWNSNCNVSCYVHIPDANFKAYLVGNSAINTNGNNEIECSEASSFVGGYFTAGIYINGLNISDLTGLETFTNFLSFTLINNSINSIDLSSNINLLHLDVTFVQSDEINLDNNTLLESVSIRNCPITSLDLSNNLNLTHLTCSQNQLTTLDVSLNSALTKIICGVNPLTSLNVANGNNVNVSTSDFNAANNPNLTCIQVDDVAYSTINWTNIDAGASFSLNCSVPPCVVNIPDANFKAYLVGNAGINTNGNTEIECSEASAFTGFIDCSNSSISDLTGIEAFTGLTQLYCNNNNLTSLDLTACSNLFRLNCASNVLTSLTGIANNVNFTRIDCQFNQLNTINISNCTNLNWFWCFSNQITTLNLSNNTSLTNLHVEGNPLNNLNLSTNTLLEVLNCGGTQLTSLNLSNNINSEAVKCLNNSITDLNLSMLNSLTELDCRNNQLITLNLQNGNNTNFGNFSYNSSNNPNLTCIQVDDAAYSSTNWTNIDATASFSETCSFTGVKEAAKNNLIAYPNPTNGLVSFSTSEKIELIEIYNLAGQKVVQFNNQNTIDISSLPNGIYTAKVIIGVSSPIIERLIKN